ncbi:Bacterial extracellular solute-binding protein, family 3 [Piscirickettsiaceae bacterium NZ-RLO1]|nr:Bacterial extracellular solute-binding protein, family 3 [Piscirickettsiaceae bacterium NZ-RLO1]
MSGARFYPPLEWTDKNNQLAGAGYVITNYVITKKILSKLGVKPVIVRGGGIARTLSIMENTSNIDMITSITYNKDRAKFLDYIQPAYTKDQLAIFVKKGEDFRCEPRSAKHGVSRPR